jgi:hypothetical protein
MNNWCFITSSSNSEGYRIVAANTASFLRTFETIWQIRLHHLGLFYTWLNWIHYFVPTYTHFIFRSRPACCNREGIKIINVLGWCYLRDTKWQLQTSVASSRWSIRIKSVTLFSSLVLSGIFLCVIQVPIMSSKGKLIKHYAVKVYEGVDV